MNMLDQYQPPNPQSQPAPVFDDQECGICLFERVNVVLNCQHEFCETCITNWIDKEKNNCPLCMRDIRRGSQGKDGKDNYFTLIDKEEVVGSLEARIF